MDDERVWTEKRIREQLVSRSMGGAPVEAANAKASPVAKQMSALHVSISDLRQTVERLRERYAATWTCLSSVKTEGDKKEPDQAMCTLATELLLCSKNAQVCNALLREMLEQCEL
jgi:hypothetical protein